MEFREYATHETASVVDRLLTSQAEAQVQRAREALEAASRALATPIAAATRDEDVRDLVQRLEAAAGIAVQRVQQDAQRAIDAARQELAGARHEADEARAQTASLRDELTMQTDRAATAEADLDATIEAHREIEMELAGLREVLGATRREAAKLSTELEAESARSGILLADLALSRDAHARLEASLTSAQAAVAEEADARGTLEGELEAARSRLAALEDSRASLRAELERVQASRQGVEADLEAGRKSLEARSAELAIAREGIEALERELAAAKSGAQATTKELEASQAAVQALGADLSAARVALAAAKGDLSASQAALRAAEAARDRVPLVQSAATACRQLKTTASVAELLGALVRHVSTEFTRAAIFRAKAHHLEGEHAVGFEAPSDVSKLIVPLSLESIITRSHASGEMAHLVAGETAGGIAPFGGAPHLAVAVPVVFQGEVLAVLYADADEPPAGVHDERPAFAQVMCEQATLLLARMSQELKTLHELRDYATMLVQEAEQMYVADLESGRTEADRRRRLQDTIECARQLYAQRAALEGTSAAGLLDEQVAAVVNASPATPFAQDLALVAGREQDARRNAS